MRAVLFLMVLAGGAGGLMLAGRGDEPPPLAATPSPRPAAPSAPARAMVERDPGGHFIATAEVNGHPIRVVVDTGASAVVLTPEDARAAGLLVDPARWSRVGRSATGEARGERLILASLSVGGVRRMDVPAAVVEGLPVSLLGQSFLRRLEAAEIRGDTMTLR